MTSPEVDLLIKQAISALIAQAELTLAQGAIKGVSQAGVNALRPLATAGMLKEGNDELFERMFVAIANRAATTARTAYQNMIVAEEKGGSATHYRAGEGRLAGGIMAAALSRSDWIQTSATGIDYGNISVLSEAAFQWGRLAFGAGGRGTGSVGSYKIDMPGLSGVLELDEAARPGFNMPYGIWMDLNGKRVSRRGGQKGDIFKPTSKVLGVPTEGIRGRDFLSKGLEEIATGLNQQLPAVITQIVEKWAKTLKGETTSVRKKFVPPKV
jgi:hypothetical protein